jgi:alpha-tubulin suppressor-like RCC1 family protein
MNKPLFNRRTFSALLVAAGLVLAACSSGGSTNSRQRNAALPIANQRVSVNPVSISAGGYHSLAIDNTGQIYAWGWNDSDQTNVPELRNGAKQFTTIAAGGYHSLAMDDIGQIYAWGYNDYGQINVPELRNGAKQFTTITAGFFHSLAIDDIGQIYAWGYNDYGQINVPELRNGAKQFTTIAAGAYHSLAIDDIGQIYAWGYNNFGQTNVPELRNGAKQFTTITAGAYHSLAIDDIGQIYAWGWNDSDQTNVPELRNGAKQFTTITAGSYHSLAIDDIGQIYAWGNNGKGQTNVPELRNGAKQFTTITAGFFHSLAIDNTGQIYAWGNNGKGQTVVPPVFDATTARSMPIAMGGTNAFGVSDTGEVVSFTNSPYGTDPSYVSVAAGPSHTLAVTSSGSVEGWGSSNVGGKLNIPGDLNGVVQVAAGFAYSAALRSNGTVVEWGSHTAPKGQLVDIPNDLPLIRHIEGGLTHLLAITNKGKVLGWGSNENGKATPPSDLDDVIDVAANDNCSVALRSNGDLVYWGACSDALISQKQALSASSIALTRFSAVAIVNGSLFAWGEDWDQTLTTPTGDNFVAIAGGSAAFLAVTADGNVSAWGTNNYETITIPESFGGAPPNMNNEICDDCDWNPEQFVVTDEFIKEQGAFLSSLLTPDERAKLIETLGGSATKPLSPLEIQALIDAATSAERASAQAVLKTSSVFTPVVQSVAAVLPAAQSPDTKIGSKVSTKKAATMLGLKKVTSVKFVTPKKSIRACTITAQTITAKKTGTCIVKVRYNDAKKKARTSTLTLKIG